MLTPETTDEGIATAQFWLPEADIAYNIPL